MSRCDIVLLKLGNIRRVDLRKGQPPHGDKAPEPECDDQNIKANWRLRLPPFCTMIHTLSRHVPAPINKNEKCYDPALLPSYAAHEFTQRTAMAHNRAHTRLDLFIARNRYIKYCYFETYQRAVQALQVEKRNSNREQRKITALKNTTSFKQGLVEDLPATPHTDRIHQTYGDLSEEEKRRRAPDMVKDEIAKKVARVYEGSMKKIRSNINKYIREGKILHHILQGAVCLNPGLLILFPGRESDQPSLEAERFRLELDEKELKSLTKAIDMKE
ncbi:hypothetical protein EK21DRAFT_93722 [Setomelanomma holmii]|uniref:Uncharacterized protein n=1 Tax=Setomelanomma holmii TaxID=210430 RepID=A0A9P4GZH9_9PLEO|nr:hypothetical protein EK21DRAFT_93722 [Setomelanomma holmii]